MPSALTVVALAAVMIGFAHLCGFEQPGEIRCRTTQSGRSDLVLIRSPDSILKLPMAFVGNTQMEYAGPELETTLLVHIAEEHHQCTLDISSRQLDARREVGRIT